MRKWITSDLLRRVLLAMLVVSLVPLAIMANFSQQSYTATKTDVVDQSRRDFDQKSLEGLQARTLALARLVALFLSERENDVRLLATLPRTSETYLAFAQASQGKIWTVTGNGKEITFDLPLYRQIAFVDARGQQIIVVNNECSAYPFTCNVEKSAKLGNVSEPQNNLYQDASYLTGALALGPGHVYVGTPIGAYVPYERAYASAQNRDGERYRGILNFAMPVYEGTTKIGVVVASVELLHLIELSAHVAPANPNLQAEVDPREADLTYLVDPQGLTISHPRHFAIAGLDAQSKPVVTINEQDRNDPNNLYRPGNLSQMGFIDPAFPEMIKHNQAGTAQTGETLSARPLGARERALAFATIPYFAGRYDTPAGFGLVVMSTDGARFHLEAELLGKQIENRITDFIVQLQRVGAGTLIVGFILAIVLARSVVWPVVRLTDAAREIEKGEWQKANVEQLAQTRGRDEVASLSRVFASMAKQVQVREQQLRQQVQELQIVIDEAKRERQVAEITDTEFFQDLANKASRMREKRKS
jgi:hypothetical protein